MKKSVLMLAILMSSFAASALPISRPMTAVEVAVSVAYADFTNPNCTLYSNLDVNNPADALTFTLHTATKDETLIFNPADPVMFVYDRDTGAEAFKAVNFEVTVVKFTKITSIKINGTECAP